MTFDSCLFVFVVVVVYLSLLFSQANDYYQGSLPMPVIQLARSLFSSHDVAWRESDKAR